MNERIRELAHEAGLPTYHPDGRPTKLEKFAELLIQDCARVMDELNEAYGAPSTAGEFIKRYYEIDV